MIGIGIDTGGTCTDAVVYDVSAHQVLSWSKTNTTKQDLKIGIIKALQGLDPAAVCRAEYISLSTTLATNACVENKGGRARLVFIGIPPKAIRRMSGEYGLPPTEEIVFLKGNPRADMEEEKTPDWDAFRKELDQFAGYDSVAIVQINPVYNNGAYEKIAAQMIEERFHIPCVRGYDLYQEINVQRRGATALLNARLLSVMKDFFDSIDASLAEMGIRLPIVIVKSNGNLMTREYAKSRPVDTLLSGPAASVMGALELSSFEEGIVADIGGTTTDVAVVRARTPVASGLGINIGSWSTMVKGISIDTFGLGGDTAVHNNDGELVLDTRRAVPLCVLASEYPEVRGKLLRIMQHGIVSTYPAIEFFVLAGKIQDLSFYTEREQAILKALEKGPLSYEETASAAGVSPQFFQIGRLEEEGTVLRAGVTPTDVMHCRGDFLLYDRHAAEMGIRYLSVITGRSVKEVCDKVYQMVRQRLYDNLVRIMTEKENGCTMSPEESGYLSRITEQVFRHFQNHHKSQFMDIRFRSQMPVIGVGGPARIFLDGLGDLLETEVDHPEHRLIANAIGATVGRISCSFSVRIEPDNLRNWGSEYYVLGSGQVEGFSDYDKAKTRAGEIAVERLREVIAAEGIDGSSEITLDYKEDFWAVEGHADPVFVMTIVTAKVESDVRNFI